VAVRDTPARAPPRDRRRSTRTPTTHHLKER
jgi:hypothetical protein